MSLNVCAWSRKTNTKHAGHKMPTDSYIHKLRERESRRGRNRKSKEDRMTAERHKKRGG